MTEWGLIAVVGIPSFSVVSFMLGRFWESLGHEPAETNTPKMHPSSIRYLAERNRRR